MVRSISTATALILLASCGPNPDSSKEADIGALRIESSAFDDGEPIPAQFTCDGDNLSPPLAFRGVPKGTKSFVVTVDDPDAPGGNYRHWGAYNIPFDKPRVLAGAGLPSSGGLDQVVNSDDKKAYAAPCPPPGTGPHRYRFKVYALNKESLEINPEDGVGALQSMAATHALGEATMIGTYERK